MPQFTCLTTKRDEDLVTCHRAEEADARVAP
jgi:hypothetical protein